MNVGILPLSNLSIHAVSMDKLREWRKDNGLCLYCGCEIDRAGIYCYKCLDKVNSMTTVIRARNKEKGLCLDCGKPIDRKGSVCSKCLEKSNSRVKELMQYRRENHLCPRCGEESIDYIYCIKCRNERMKLYYNIPKNKKKK